MLSKMTRNIKLISVKMILNGVKSKSSFNKYITRFINTQPGYVAISNFNISDYQEMKPYQEFVEESRIGAGKAAITLMKTLDVTRENAVNAVTVWPIFATLSRYTIIENNKLLRSEGVDKSTLRLNMYALANTFEDLNFKIKLLQTLDLDLNGIIPLFRLPRHLVSKLIALTTQDNKFILQRNRIHYFSEKFKCEPYFICDILCDHPYVLYSSINNIISKTEYLLDSGVTAEHILKDLTVYNYSLFTIKNRIERALRANVHPIKPWVIRCSENIIEDAEKRSKLRKELFQSAKSLEEYISQILDCEISAVQALLERNPSIRSIQLTKLTKNLKFFRDCGYTIEDIFRAPRSLNYGYESNKEKYNTWMQHNLGRPRISVITGSKKIFDRKLAEALAKK